MVELKNGFRLDATAFKASFSRIGNARGRRKRIARPALLKLPLAGLETPAGQQHRTRGDILLKLPLAGLETGNDTSFCDILPAFFKEGGT